MRGKFEALECMVERRKGGETGIRSVERIEGDAVWKWRDGAGLERSAPGGRTLALSRTQTRTPGRQRQEACRLCSRIPRRNVGCRIHAGRAGQCLELRRQDEKARPNPCPPTSSRATSCSLSRVGALKFRSRSPEARFGTRSPLAVQQAGAAGDSEVMWPGYVA